MHLKILVDKLETLDNAYKKGQGFTLLNGYWFDHYETVDDPDQIAQIEHIHTVIAAPNRIWEDYLFDNFKKWYPKDKEIKEKYSSWDELCKDYIAKGYIVADIHK